MITMPKAGREAIVVWARKAAPLEDCGLIGAYENDESTVTHLWPCANAAASTHHFRIAQDDLERIVMGAARSHIAIIGGWHSHLGCAAEPSAADLAMAPFPEWVHVIVSLYTEEPEVRAWRGRTELAMTIAGA